MADEETKQVIKEITDVVMEMIEKAHPELNRQKEATDESEPESI